jgi:hypothetical protein
MTAEERLEPVFGPDGLPDAATLAGLQLDAFDAQTTARIRAALNASPHARETLAALDAVRDQLHDQPTPRMPDAVADRISAALRAEQDARSAPAPVVSLDAARERRARRNRWMGLAAAGVAVIAAGGIVYGVTTRTSTGGNGNPGAQPGFIHQNGQSSGQPGGQQQTQQPLPRYSKSDLASKLPQIVAAGKIGINIPNATTGGGLNPTTCARTLGEQGNPIAAERITFEGQDSYVLVFPTGVDHQAKVYVVSPDCSGTPRYETSGQY